MIYGIIRIFSICKSMKIFSISFVYFIFYLYNRTTCSLIKMMLVCWNRLTIYIKYIRISIALTTHPFSIGIRFVGFWINFIVR